MAKKIGIELDFNTKQAQKSAKEFADEVDVVTGSLEDLEAQQDELLKKLKGVEVGTAEFKELAAELNGIKSEIKDAELAFEGLDMEQRFTAATDALGGVAGGFAAVEGAIAIAGVESAEFEETMLRVQGAMALAMGIKDISTAVAALNKLNVAAKLAAAGQKVLNFVMSANPIGLIVTAIGLLVAGFIAFSDKIKSVVMPILQPLIDAFDWLGRQIQGLRQVTDLLGITESKLEKARIRRHRAHMKRLKEEKRQVIENYEEYQKIQANNKDIINDRIKDVEQRIKLAEAEGKSIKELEEEKSRIIKAGIKRNKTNANNARRQEREALTRMFDNEKNLLDRSIDFRKVNRDNIVGLIEEAEAKQKYTISDTKRAELEVLKQRLGAYARYTLEVESLSGDLKDQEIQDAIDAANEERKQLEKRQRAWRKYQENTRQLQQEYEDVKIENIQDEETREIEKLKLDYDRRKQEINDTIADEKAKNDLLQQEKIRYEQELLQTTKKYADERQKVKDEELQKEISKEDAQFELKRSLTNNKQQQEEDDLIASYENKFEIAENNAELEKILQQQLNKDLKEINDKYRSEEEAADKDKTLKSIQNAEAERQAKLSVAESTVAGLASLSKIAIRDSQKAEKIQKAFALAQIAIDTAKAISALVAASQANPLNAVTVGGAGAAQFASGIATILANMAQAAALLKRPSPNVSNLSSSAGGGVAGAGVPINAVQNGSTLIGNNEPQREVNKVVVVESDITSTQQGISQIQSQATVVE